MPAPPPTGGAAVPATTSPATTSSAPATLRECPDCGLFVRLPSLPRATLARCPRCGAVLCRQRTNPEARALAFATTGLLLLAVAASTPFLRLDMAGQTRQSVMLSGPTTLAALGFDALALVVLATTVLIPSVRLGGIALVLSGLRLRLPRRPLARVFAWDERLAPWSMVEVFLLGAFVAYTKLADLALVQIGPAAYALGALMLATAATDATIDRDALWRALAPHAAPPNPAHPIGCDVCGLVCDAAEGSFCPRCASRLHRRKPHSLQRTVALLLAAAILYIPANLLPVMTVISFGQGGPNTILSGVEELAAAGMWPLALLVFFASITVPVLKLVGLTGLILATRRGSRRRLRERTVLFRIVDAVGRWSMIDVFMVSILTGLVRLDAIASIIPGPGVMAFCAVVILTMLAAATFDPRLMWDARR